MGAVCSCFGVSASNDHGNSTDTPCFCFGCCLQKIKNKYASIRGGPAVVPPPNNNSAPTGDSMVELNTSTTVVSSRGNQRYSRVPPHEEAAAAASRSQDKGGSGHSRVQLEHHHQHRDDDVQEASRKEAKLSDASNNGKLLKEGESEGSTEYFSSELDIVHSQLVLDIEEEDCCPTCLEGYTLENPKIVAKCSHHYHLGCIYEWKERSESCPVCGKLMAFDEML